MQEVTVPCPRCSKPSEVPGDICNACVPAAYAEALNSGALNRRRREVGPDNACLTAEERNPSLRGRTA